MKTKPIPVPKDWQKLKHHLYSRFVAFGVGIDMDALTASMRLLGYLSEEPIYLFKGEILGGRHRHEAAIKADVVPTFREFVGTDLEALQFVECELGRRHLTESQRAMFVAEMFKMKREQIPSHPEENPPTQSETAKSANVSHGLLGEAVKVVEKGTSAVQEAVKSGTLSVPDAAKIVNESPKVQDRAAKAVEQGKARTASQAVKTCERCLRLGSPVKDCPQCKELASQKSVRSAPSRNGKPGKAKSTNGQPVFDPAEADQISETARKLLDRLYRQYGVLGRAGTIKDDDAAKDIMKIAKQAASSLKGRARELMLEAKDKAKEEAKAKKE